MDFNNFYETFNVKKVEYLAPSRTVDEDGEISEYYVEECYPSLDPNFIDLLDFYNAYYKNEGLKLDSYELKYQLCEALLNKCNSLEGDEREAFIEEVKEIIES